MNLSENIQKFRKEKEITQEQLGEILGVSSQAVSKWERSDTYPDGTLLLPLANALDVSLDELFGNDAVPSRSIIEGIGRLMGKATKEERFKLARIICWQIENGMFFGNMATFNPRGLEYNRNTSTIEDNNGFTWISNGDGPFFSVFEKREDEWEKVIGDGESARKKFECLGNPDTMKAVLYLYRQKYGDFTFEAAYLAKECGFDKDRVDEVITNLQTLGLIRRLDIVLDGVESTLWSVCQSPLIIALMIISNQLDYNGVYSLQSGGRTEPYLK